MDYVIVTHPLFREQAEQLKLLHETVDGFKTLLTEPEQIYNEFSSGKQDPTAIRDMMKMFYEKYPDNNPRYLLLFGDGSFDLKDRIEHNTNFIPTFQTEESLTISSSYVVDDYFGILDDDEGEDAHGYLDIGIGRIPSQTIEEAQTVVDKIVRYVAGGGQQFGEWRNTICVIADDEDGNLHLEQADSLADGLGFVPKVFNKVKVYLDAFQQEKSPSGERYPDVHKKIKDQVNTGALLVNYIGHGGTGGWAHERVLQQPDILNWSNIEKLPVFITATCEFTRFDEPEIYSGGELVLLNPNGGGIALFTTTRLAYAQSNFRLNERIYARAFTPVNGKMPYLGDLIRESKPPSQLTTRNFVLLGDPAIRMAYPEYKIITKSINGKTLEVGEYITDTLKSLQEITVIGEINNLDGQLMNDFNGIILPTVYDKSTIYKTIGNDAASYPVEFTNQDKILWKGTVSVSNGQFTFSFILPRDMALNFGSGKISYYAFSESHDASGEFSSFIIGGIDENATVDNTGPQIDLFLNNLYFKSGDQTHENPLMLVFLNDENGINLSTNGIGHNITAVLNDDHSNAIQLNKYYVADTNSYKGGSIEYPFYNLPDGTYTLTVKAWDSYNNSSEETITFVINRNALLQLSQVKNFPNPFTDHTTFSFKHTKPGEQLSILLEIVDLTGNYITAYETKITSESTELPFLVWNATNEGGSRVESGVYIYVLTITDEQGQVSKQRQKLIVY
ncbi:MAG: type IX secretion system sortase PorU [Bacteroidales bacterium]